jgi:hypothetical protein
MKMEQIECSEMSAYKIQTPGNYPEESIQRGIYSLRQKCQTYILPSTRETRVIYLDVYEISTRNNGALKSEAAEIADAKKILLEKKSDLVSSLLKVFTNNRKNIRVTTQ